MLRSILALLATMFLLVTPADADRKDRPWQKGMILRKSTRSVGQRIATGRNTSFVKYYTFYDLDIVGKDASYSVSFKERDATRSWEQNTEVTFAVKDRKTLYLLDDEQKEFKAEVVFISAKDSVNAVVGDVQSGATTGQPEDSRPEPPPTRPGNDGSRQVESAASLTPLKITSEPAGAEITIDDKYAGNAPSTIRLAPGEHLITVTKPGYRTWKRVITVTPGSELNVQATLERNSP